MDPLDLVFRRLVLAAQAADALARPIDIGEIIETLVPYAAARRDGLDTHDDYLHAVMRLAAGERDLAFGDDLMQDDLRNELASSNPDVGVIRTYLNAKLRLSTQAVQGVLAGDTDIDLRPPTPTAEPPSAGAPPSPAPREGAAGPAGDATGAEPRPAPRVSTPALPTDTEDQTCPYCAQELPTGRVVRFCPHCGINLRIRRCPGCSAEIESEWKFCVTCGRSAV